MQSIMTKESRYAFALTVKFPQEVWKAMQKRVEDKQTKFPRYSEADLVRTSVVKHLKEKKLLDEAKRYL